MSSDSKSRAQERADQIGLFNEELRIPRQEKVVELTDGQQAAINGYHQQLLAQLSREYDIDISKKEKHLSFGMRVASFLGALALAISIFFLFYQYWGRFSTLSQIAVLVTAPVVALFATLYVSDREKTGYFAKLLGLITLACFVLDISVLGRIYNITPSDNAFIVWAALAFLLAYRCDLRLLLAAGIVCIGGVLSARVGAWHGMYWLYFGMRPENFLPVGILFFVLPFFLPHRGYSGFLPVYRVFGLMIFFIPVLVLSYAGGMSYSMLDDAFIEAMYQIIGFSFSACLVALGIRRGLNEVTNTANTFFVIFLYTKVYDWWWDWMPKYLFFLLVGLIAVLMLFVFRRLRNAGKAVAGEVL